jgi:hypothetical protein
MYLTDGAPSPSEPGQAASDPHADERSPDRLPVTANSPEPATPGANDKLPVTPEMTPLMIAAGVAAYWEWEETENYRIDDLVKTLYLRLRALEHQT